MQGVSNFIRASLVVDREVSKREKLQKKQASTSKLYQSTKSTGFPSTKQFFQGASEYLNTDISCLNVVIKNHESGYRQVEKTLKANLISAFSYIPLSLEERLSRLENA